MVLSDNSIKDLGSILVKPFKAQSVQPASYELHLGDQFKVEPAPSDAKPKMVQRGEKEWEDFNDDGIAIRPGEFILATTKEKVYILPNMIGVVFGKSSWGRMGLMIHVTAGLLDPGFNGQVTLELVNLSHDAIILKEGDPIAQVVFQRLDHEADKPYGSKGLNSHYQNQSGATPSKA